MKALIPVEVFKSPARICEADLLFVVLRQSLWNISAMVPKSPLATSAAPRRTTSWKLFAKK
jgi:hypothetical protein